MSSRVVGVVRPWLRYALAVLGHYSGLDALLRRLSGPGLVILMFHRFSDVPDPHPITVRPATFGRLVRWCSRKDLLVDLDDGVHELGHGRAGTPYAITIDDGYHDNLAALEALPSPVTATLYVATGHIGGDTLWPYALSDALASSPYATVDLRAVGFGSVGIGSPAERSALLERLVPEMKKLSPERFRQVLAETIDALGGHGSKRIKDMLDWDEIRRLHALGVVIGAHTVSHPILSRADDETALREIRQSRDRITAELGAAPRHFAYPNGGPADFTDRDVTSVYEAGFSTAVTTVEGVNRPSTDRFRLYRYNIHEGRFRSPGGRLSRAVFFSETSGLLAWVRGRR